MSQRQPLEAVASRPTHCSFPCATVCILLIFASEHNKAVITQRGSVDELFGEFKGILPRYITHRRQYQTHPSAFDELRSTLRPGHVLMVVDFQERLSVKEQDEVQSQHWDNDNFSGGCLSDFEGTGVGFLLSGPQRRYGPGQRLGAARYVRTTERAYPRFSPNDRGGTHD